MKKLLFPLIIFCMLLAACSSENSQPSPTAPPTQTSTAAAATSTPVADTLTTRLEQYMQTQKPSFSGTILVVQKGEILLNQGYGFADHELEIPNTPQTKFAIGSMSKAFTALAIMMLQERGQLNVQDSICAYLSDCPEAWQPITLHHLLTHTSGIFNYTDLDPAIGDVNICREYKPEEVIAFFKDLPLDFEPGSRWSYSNSGYFLLGVVIEKVSAESYETFIQKNIFQPLGMSDSGYDRSSTIVKQRATGYSGDSGHLSNADCWDVSLKYAACGLYSTVGDLYKWDQALYTSPLVSSDTLNTLFTSTASSEWPGKAAYAYGWFIYKRFGHRVIEHGGLVFGFSSQIDRFPDDDLTVIVLSNTDFEDPESISAGLAGIVFDGK